MSCSRTAAGAAHALAVGGHLATRGRADRRGVGPRPRGHRPAPAGAAARAAQRRAAAGGAGRPRRRRGPRARELRRLPGEVARGGSPEAGRAGAGPRGDGARLLRPRGAQPHLSPPARGDRRAPGDARQSRGRRAHPARGAARPQPQFQLSPKQTRVRAAARRLEFDLLRFLRSEADSDSRFEPVELERDVRDRGRRARSSSRAACACAGASTAWTSTTAWRS